MDVESFVFGILFTITILCIYYFYCSSEKFASKEEKVNKIIEWSTKLGGDPSYVNFRDFVKKTDIVEYDKVKSAIDSGKKLSSEIVEKLIN